jgi:hypothetical protein
MDKFHELFYPKSSGNEAKSSPDKKIDTHNHKSESADSTLPTGSDAISGSKTMDAGSRQVAIH